jgi:galactose mutarotase-like enzyme
MMDRYEISNGTISATIKADGAELCSLRNGAGKEMLWQAGPIWPRSAPILFPIVGRLKNDELRLADKTYRLTQHGFARDRPFAWLTRSAADCRLLLQDDARSRAVYPFAFRLEIAFTLDGDALEQSFTLSNPGPSVLPASLGAHPGFNWPLGESVEKAMHVIEFAQPETGPVRRLRNGLLRVEPEASILGKELQLNPALFHTDALILSEPVCRSARYSAPGTAAIEVSWQGFTQLGIWSRTGGDFLCIEPWYGMASPEDFDGNFMEKPGLMLIPPGERRHLSMRIRLC